MTKNAETIAAARDLASRLKQRARVAAAMAGTSRRIADEMKEAWPDKEVLADEPYSAEARQCAMDATTVLRLLDALENVDPNCGRYS